MGERLIDTARGMGGEVNPWQGELSVRVPTTDGTGRYWRIAFYFSSWEEMGDLLRRCKEKGFQPDTDVMNLKVDMANVPKHLQEPGPGCPHHGVEKLAQSRKPGWLFCKARMPDGSYCKHTEPE